MPADTRKHPTATCPDIDKDSGSSNEEIPGDVEPELVNCYNLHYPVLSSTALPDFKEHKFWHSFGNSPGHELLTYALRARTPGGGVKKKNIGHILCNGLPYFVSPTSIDSPGYVAP
jgi:hypothetical protein